MASIIYDSAYGGTPYEGTLGITLALYLQTLIDPPQAKPNWTLILLPTGPIEIYYTYLNGVQRTRYTSNVQCGPGQIAADAVMLDGTLYLQDTGGNNYAKAINAYGMPPIPGACLVLTASGYAQIGCPAPASEAAAQSLIANGFANPWWQDGSFVAL